jgi:hypothetical protein
MNSTLFNLDFLRIVPPTLLILVTLVFLVITLTQIYSLMTMPSSAFSGVYDKPLWLVILLLVPLGWLLFILWKGSQKTTVTNEKITDAEVQAKLLLIEQQVRQLRDHPPR